MSDSRLTRRSLKQSKRQLYISLGAIVVLLFVAINFGPLLLGGLGNVLDKMAGKPTETKIVSDADIQPPLLDPLPEATPSGRIDVTGRAYYQNGEVELYVNSSKEDTVSLDSQDFEFKDVPLSKGNNIIKVRMIINDKKSDFSETEIARIEDAPKLDITSPSDRASFSKADQEISVSGTTDSENSVRINDSIAIVDSGGNFSRIIKLSDGDNKITVVATNPAGKTTSKEITVSYSP